MTPSPNTGLDDGVLYALFYQPPCGQWYVHSHKLYCSDAAAREAAGKFLHPETPFSVLAIDQRDLGTPHEER